MTLRYVTPPAYCQYDWSDFTARYGCVWTTVSNGLLSSTGKSVNPDRVHAKVKNTEETNPKTPGWSIPDAILATTRLGGKLRNRTGQGWTTLVALHDNGFPLLVQGDSDRFPDGTCSGKFEDDHCILVHPEEDDLGRWLIYDPICKTYRFEDPEIIKRYATKLAGSGLRFAQFEPRAPIRTIQATGSVACRAGTYAKYRTVNGRAERIGTMKTGGFSARAVAFRAIQTDGSGKTSLVKLLTGAHEGVILGRFAKGLKYIEA